MAYMSNTNLPENYVRPVVRGSIDGNAFAVMGAVSSAMKKAKISKELRDAYMEEAMSGDYDHLLAVSMKYADIRL